jgi:hydrogenase nickel incorporation protein HypA/HybF
MREIQEENGYAAVASVTLHVGALQMVVPDALDFAFDALTRGTQFEKTNLIQQVMPARGRCRTCGVEQERDSLFSPCESCEGYDFQMLSGMELTIAQMEVETDV